MSGQLNGRSAWMVGAMAVLVVGAMVVAGPITPPSGAIAPTGKTLQEIFDKPSGDGRIAIAGGSSTVVIAQPGSYVLTGDMTYGSQTAITIASDNVTLDLNGHSLRGSGSLGVGIGSAGAHVRVHIRNGQISGGQSGINLTAIGEVVVEDVRVDGASVNGISVTGDAGLPSGVVRRCVVTNTGLNSPTNVSPIVGVKFQSLNGVVEDCVVDTVVNNFASGQATGISATFGTRCVVAGNRVISAPTGISVTNSVSVVLRENIVLGSATAFSAGAQVTDGGGNIPTP